MAGHAQLKFCHDGMPEDTNSLDGAHMFVRAVTNVVRTCDPTPLLHESMHRGSYTSVISYEIYETSLRRVS